MKPSNESVQDCILNWLQRLSKHFNVELTEDQVEIFTHALKGNTAYQVGQAFERCLNECEFMPRLAQVHERMPEQKYATENPGRFVLADRPILDLVRDIVREQHPNYDSITDGAQIKDIFAAANRERYRRMGIDPDKWHGRAGRDGS